MATGDNLRKSFLIVGVGASAGGLDAFQRFLNALPEDFGFALVFIQHLSSKHKSLLGELLSARRPSLVIQQISDGLKIQPGRLYLAPPGKEVRLRNGFFQTSVHPEGLIHLPIDELLSSLAEDATERSIAVILSGAGTDGSRGCQAVRSVGGTVFIQDPETAEFGSMPLAAIATGRADAVLAPEDIATELLKIQGIAGAAVGREYTITVEEFDGFFRILQEKIGARFTHFKKSVVSRRIRRRMYLHGFTTIKAYLDLISADDSEAALLASDLMIGVTSFFRDRLAWRVLNAEAVRKIAAENTSLPIRVWTPATATGEEAYSIAMMLLQELALAGKKRDLYVFATDVNDRALERAREGRYPVSITADVPQEYIQKYFTSSDNGNVLVINKDVRESVVFARQDLLTDPPFSKLDLIICRNFLIYLEPEAQEKCMTLFHYALNDGGYLFLGNAETVGRKSAFFKSIGRKQCRIYRKLETKPASRPPISIPYISERAAAQTAKQAQLAKLRKSVTEVIQDKLLEEFAPASVAIDQNFEIIYHNGPTNRYLRQPRGMPTQNLLELVPENLRSRIRGALFRSSREERPVVIRTSVSGDDNKKRHVTLRITKAAENLSIMIFQEKAPPSTQEAAEQIDAAIIEETAIHQLEGELSATKADLQSHIEQLKSMNEELQSSNEELQAANEELETSREELQSLNEELITVNAQLQSKIEEQDATNNDLNNFLASTNIPTIFLDTHFSVKRFTPAMLKLIKLLPSDVGRPIVDMSQENLGPDLISSAQSVLKNLVPVRQELEIGSAWYVRTTLPYRTADNRIEGVVITYNDVSDLKKSEERTKHLASFPELNPNPVCEVHPSGRVTFCNPATEKVLINLGMGIEDLTAFLPEDIDDILRDLEKQEETSLYREIVIRDRVFGMTVHLAPQFNVVRIYAYDITERKKAEEALRENEQRLNRSQGIAHLGSWELDLVNNRLFWSDEVYRIFGLKPREFDATYEAFLDAVHPDDRVAVDAAYSRSIHEGKDTYEIEHRVVRKVTGEVRYVHEKCEHFRDETGSIVRSVGMVHDITERKKAEEALRESEDRVRRKLDSILSPEGDLGNLELSDIIDAGSIQDLMDNFYNIARMPMSIIDLKGKMLVGVGWQKICTEFHRVHPETCRNCTESDLQLSLGLSEGEFKLYKCKNNMWDVATPIFVGGKHMGNLFMGQFFFEDEPLDYEFFRAQARQYGFDEKEYLAALQAVPRLSREVLDESMAFFMKLAAVLSKASYGTFKLARSLAQGEALTASLRESEEQFRTLADSIPNLAWWANSDGYITWYNQRWYEYTGTTPEQMEGWGWQSVHDPGMLPKVLERWKASIATGQPFDMEFPLRGADGVFRSFLTRVLPLKDPDGLVTRWFGTNTDVTERKRAEESLRESEERYRSLFENMMHGFAHCKMLYDESGRPSDFVHLDVNSAFTKLTGLQNVAGRRITEVIPGIRETHPELFDIYGRVASTGQPEKFEIEFKPLKRWFAISVYSTAKENFVAIFDDITDRKKAEMALFESEERYRSIIETASEGIWIGDFEGRTTFVNESVTKMMGYGPEELIGKTALDFMDEEARVIARLNLEQRRQGRKNSYELKFIRKDGSTLWAIVGATPLRDKNGSVVASIAMITDITERKLVEERTRHQQAVLTSINRIFREALTAGSEEELGRACLSIAEELTGSKFGFIGEIGPDGLLHDTAISDSGWDLCAMKDKTGRHKPVGAFSVHGLVGRVILDERPFFTNDPYSHRDSIGTPEGHPRLTAFLGVPLIHRGKTIGLLALGNREGGYRTEDVETMEPLATVIVQALMRKRTESSLQTAHAELKQRAYELEAVNRELEDYSYTVSHDLKTPLRSIDGFARALLEDYGDKLDATAKDYLVRVNSAALRMNQLIQAMLDMARLTRRELNEQSVDLSALAQAIADNLRKQDPARMVEFIIADNISVRGDNALLQAVVENLMHNAWKFTGKHKTARIEFGAATMEGHSVYFVKDDGAGFDMQYAGKLFMPFNRFHTESEFAGLGIGLATAYRIILRHNGRLWAESAPEKGATFYFTLP